MKCMSISDVAQVQLELASIYSLIWQLTYGTCLMSRPALGVDLKSVKMISYGLLRKPGV